jgi:DNA-binding CsgD family transcriptional regulator/pimeloyl-ACP methyl ester carboxylesterase
MEPRIQFGRTADGVDIAFATAGDGLPLVLAAPPLAHVQGRWEFFARLYQSLAAHFQLIWYDSRGCGLSDRDAVDFSMEAMIRDLEAVVRAAGLTRFRMAAFYDAVPVAVNYATVHSEKILALILADGWMKFSDYYESPAYAAEEALRGGDWIVYTETFARVLGGLEDQEFAGLLAAYIRETIAPEAWRAANSDKGYAAWDVTSELAHISAPTLVLHNLHNRLLPVQVGQRIAASIPNARFQIVEDAERVQMAGIMAAFLTSEIQTSPPRGPGVNTAAVAALSPREAEVLRLLASGKSSREIGAELVLTVRTVERHITNLYRKIGAHNRAQATAFALEHGLTLRP